MWLEQIERREEREGEGGGEVREGTGQVVQDLEGRGEDFGFYSREVGAQESSRQGGGGA